MSGGPKDTFLFVSFFAILLFVFLQVGAGVVLADYAKTPGGYYSRVPGN